MSKLPAGEEAKQRVLKDYPCAFLSAKGTVWSERGKTKIRLGKTWEESASRLPALSEDEIGKKLTSEQIDSTCNHDPACGCDICNQIRVVERASSDKQKPADRCHYHNGPFKNECPLGGKCERKEDWGKPVLTDGSAEGIETCRNCHTVGHTDWCRDGLDEPRPVEPAAPVQPDEDLCPTCGIDSTRQYYRRMVKDEDGNWTRRCADGWHKNEKSQPTPVVVPEIDCQFEHDCYRCHRTMDVRDGCDPTKYCDSCAHDLVEEFESLQAQVVVRPEETRAERQKVIGNWCVDAFGADEARSLPQRGIRLLEEAAEAAQVTGVDLAMAHKMLDYVWARPVGRLDQELGGVGVTVLALAEAAGISADGAELNEVARVLAKPIAHFAERNQAKNNAGFLTAQPTPLPSDLSMEIRKQLWLSHGCSFNYLYGDDGEMQCNRRPFIDFRNDSETEILNKIGAHNQERFAEIQAAALPVGQKETFEEWWKDSHERAFIEMPKIMQLGFKETAQAAWNAAKEQKETK